MKVFSNLKLEAKKPVKELIIAIGEDINEAVPAKENPRYSQRFWNELQEAISEMESEETKTNGKVSQGISYEQFVKNVKAENSKSKKVASND